MMLDNEKIKQLEDENKKLKEEIATLKGEKIEPRAAETNTA